MKTKLRYVGLKDRHLVVSENPLTPEQAQHVIKLRTISQNAAIRHYVKHNLPTALHLNDDGSNEPGDLVDPNPHNHYKPRREKNWAKRAASRSMDRDQTGKIVVVTI